MAEAATTRDDRSAAGPLPDDSASWAALPHAVEGSGRPLPAWARALAVHLPRTVAALLELDLAHRTRGPLPPDLRANMRWAIARANRSAYGEAHALADARRAGMDARAIATLTGDPAGWPVEDREPLEFARLHTLAAPEIPDELFARLRARFGDRGVAAMVLLGAYANFQDRVALGLGLDVEPSGPLEPVPVRFAPGAFQMTPVAGPTAGKSDHQDDGAPPDGEATAPGLDRRRGRDCRLPIPSWGEVAARLPPAMAAHPTRIVWNLVCLGYVPELAVPWSLATRTMWAEAPLDRVFEESLFWVQTQAVGCHYCMGHCEMLLEVAGLDAPAVAGRVARLAAHDWSAFPPSERRAYAYARKLSAEPYALTASDYAGLAEDLGPAGAMSAFFWLCRGLYMTRVSDGFGLPLERDNVFRDYFTPPTPGPESHP